jgi:hypothetical protein
VADRTNRFATAMPLMVPESKGILMVASFLRSDVFFHYSITPSLQYSGTESLKGFGHP